MSGGSFDYLYLKEVAELPSRATDVEHMAQVLVELGAHDAAAETLDLLAIVRYALVRAAVHTRRLSDVWHAVEWWKSGDYSKEQALEAIEKYRKGRP